MPLQVTPASAPFPGASPQTFTNAPALLGLPGTAGVPDLIRGAARRLETYSPDLGLDLEDATFTDYGNLSLDAGGIAENARLVGDACRAMINSGSIPVFFARDGRYTASAIRATADRHPELTVLQLGARLNLLDEYEGESWHARTSMQRALDRIPIDRLKHLGVRCGKKEEFEKMEEGSTLVTPADLPDLGKNGIYLSLHLTLFDPYTLPGVAHPEPGGFNWENFSKVLAQIPWDRVKACDLVGLEPSGDHTGLSTLVAAKTAREIILSLSSVNG